MTTAIETDIKVRSTAQRLNKIVLQAPPDKPGRHMLIDKRVLVVDEDYQRAQGKAKTKTIANNWSWMALACIVVALRDGVYYVIDGGHRVKAAIFRSDVTTLPCQVFDCQDMSLEAIAFWRINAGRQSVTAVQTFKALLAANYDSAIFVDALLKKAKREPNRTAGANTVACVGLLMRFAQHQRNMLTRMWPLFISLCEGAVLHERIVDALMYIETRMPVGESLTDPRWKQRLLTIGRQELLRSAGASSAMFSYGGAKVWAAGMILAINKGLRHKLPVDGFGSET